ncbi:sensor histidine kinase [Paenibacillus sepulcri]|uniref:histidine kinase n=1 Tax=Paenibacillus sepulcri TaxID=359917 RepID=A0ABS7C4Z7_9BACL|nr:sensor histidine kinase [Paenibacillus sepulcri]
MFKWLFINRSIRTKIVLSSVLISLIPMLILSYLFYETSTRSLERTMLRSSDQNAVYLSKYLDQYFHNIATSALQVYKFARIIGLMEHGVNYGDPDFINLKDTLQNYYSLIQNNNKDIIRTMIYGKDNTLKDSWSIAGSYDQIDFKSIPGYKEMLDLPFQQSMMLSYYDETMKQNFFVYAITIYNPFYKEKYGTLVFYIQQKQLTKIVESNNRPPNVIVLQNANGEAFYRTNDKYADVVATFKRPANPYVNDSYDISFSKTPNLLVSTSYLDHANMGLTIVYPSTEMAQNRKNTLHITVGAFLFVMLVILLCSILAQQYITRPIQLLGRAMKDVRKGNFHVSLKPYKYRDDLSELTRNFNFMTEKIRDLIEQDYQMQLRSKEAQILALQMQINPHFLYNTLQTIGGKAVLLGDYEIHEMCRALGDMFRYSFYEGNMESTIRQELTHVNNYLYIQQFRFDDALSADFDVQPDLMDCSIIRFVLQPIMENVIVHVWDKEMSDQLRISVGAIHERDSVIITLRDSGPGMAPDKLAALRSGLDRKSLDVFSGISIGLKNVHERIRLVYGGPNGLEIDSEPGLGTTIRIRIPYRKRRA